MAAVTEKFVGSNSGPTTSSGAGNANGILRCHGYEEVVAEDHQEKVPIWVGLNCKLVSGISKSTTCHDLISSIVPSSQDPSKYVLVEKWKKMERILDPSVKILKVWKAWGDQIGDVSFILRSSPTGDGYIDKKSTRKVHRKRSSTSHHKTTDHDDDCDKEGRRDAMEQLIKLVLTQGEAIQAQLKKLRQQEEQIDRYEEKMHKIRSSQHGENYVVDTYLKDDTKPRRVKRRDTSPSKRDSHGNHHHHHHHHYHHHQKQKREQEEAEAAGAGDTEVPKETSTNSPIDADTEEPTEELEEEPVETIRERTTLMESIFQLNVRLTQEEERLVKLGLKIRKLSDKQRKAEWEELALQDITQELEHLKQVTNEQSKEIEMNENSLTTLEQLLDDKHDHVAFLTHEIQLMDEESELLQRKVLELAAAGVSHHDQDQEYQEEASTYSVHYAPLTQGEQVNQQAFGGGEVSTTLPTPNTTIQSSQQPQGDTGSLNSYKSQICPVSSSPIRYKCQHDMGGSSSCSNSSSVCVHLTQKQQCSSSDPQDNDSNSDTGISSLHSSVDENPMYVLDTLV